MQKMTQPNRRHIPAIAQAAEPLFSQQQLQMLLFLLAAQI